MTLFKAYIKQIPSTSAYHCSTYGHLAKHRRHPIDSQCGYLVRAFPRVEEGLHASPCNRFRWTGTISSYTVERHAEDAFTLCHLMQKDGIRPNQHRLISLFSIISATKDDRELHHLTQRRGFSSDAFVGTALVNMYSKFGDIVEVEGVFQKILHHDIISWTAMLTAYVDHGEAEKALQLYHQMQAEGSAPDDRVFVFALQACGILAEAEDACFSDGQPTKGVSLNIGRALHADARDCGYASNVYVGTTLVSMYGKCGSISEAEDVFSSLPQRNVATWNAMLCTYVEQRLGERAICLYWVMLEEHVPLDDITLICILQACSEAGSLEACKQIHFHIESIGYDRDPSVVCTLIHTYGICGAMGNAEASFIGLLAPDTVSWSACIAGHAGKGDCAASVELFEKMQLVGVQPNEVTFSSVLTACSHAGLITEGLTFFRFISQEALLDPDLKHYNSMVDLFGRAGNFKGLEYMLQRMPMEGDLTFWLCLLSVCRIHGNAEIGKQAFDHAINLQPEYPAAYIILSNIYADAGLQESAAHLKSSMQMLVLEEAWQEIE